MTGREALGDDGEEPVFKTFTIAQQPLSHAQLLLSNAQLPLLDAKRANSPQRISAANSPRPSVTIPAAEVPYAIGADRR